jgi:ABC-type siderophore export system fused ATPase/permease subunit
MIIGILSLLIIANLIAVFGYKKMEMKYRTLQELMDANDKIILSHKESTLLWKRRYQNYRNNYSKIIADLKKENESIKQGLDAAKTVIETLRELLGDNNEETQQVNLGEQHEYTVDIST